MPASKYRTQIPDIEFWKEIHPCQAACPIHTDAGKYVQLIAEGSFEDSYLVARSPNPLASICGRVCAAPCEDMCRRGKIDSPVAIRALKRFVCERSNRLHPYQDDERNYDEKSGLRVVRGGSWYTASVAVLGIAYRETFQPEVSAPYLGFRIIARRLP
jgi:hypothetical protein